MSEPKMTRSDFMAECSEIRGRCYGYDVALADLAERAGVEWKPEQVEPRVGDTLTENTRLDARETARIVVVSGYRSAVIYRDMCGFCAEGGDYKDMSRFYGWEIVKVVPGSSPAEPETVDIGDTTCSSRHTWPEIASQCNRSAGHEGDHFAHDAGVTTTWTTKDEDVS